MDFTEIKGNLRKQAEYDLFRVTLHAHQEMVAEDISIDEIREALVGPIILENYPEHKRGASCLLCKKTTNERYIYVVCTTELSVAIIIITVYEPKPPKWITPFKRRIKR